MALQNACRGRDGLAKQRRIEAAEAGAISAVINMMASHRGDMAAQSAGIRTLRILVQQLPDLMMKALHESTSKGLNDITDDDLKSTAATLPGLMILYLCCWVPRPRASELAFQADHACWVGPEPSWGSRTRALVMDSMESRLSIQKKKQAPFRVAEM